jgi:hypothetical protein
MTATQQKRHSAVKASPRELREARENALQMAGLTMDELQSQARTGHFDSVRARLAWIAISGIPAI